MEKEIKELIEQNAVINTVNRLFINTDERKWQAVSDCFADEVLFDMTSMVGGEPVKLTPQQITDTWDTGLKGLKAIHHQAGNYIVTIKENEADVFCYAIATHYFPNPSGDNTFTFVGSYNFHLVKKNQSWKIDMFKFNLKYTDGNSNLSRLAQEGARH